MPEFDITYTLDKTFTVKARNENQAQERGAEILAEFLTLNEDAIKSEIHHVEG